MERAGLSDDGDWLAQHAGVLFETDERGRLTRLNEPDPQTDAPRVFVARGRASMLSLFRAEIADDIAARLAAIANDLPAWDGRPAGGGTLDRLREELRASFGETEECHGVAFRFPHVGAGARVDDLVLVDRANAHLLERHFPYTRSVFERRFPIVAAVRDGAVVSACYSARKRPTACEAGVDTVEPYRGAGLAVAVVRAWASAARAAGMTPLYSTSWDNVASLRVAAKLGLEAYADTLSFG